MSLAPSHRDRDADQILGEKLYYDSVGYLYRAVSWLDHFERTPRFTTLLYACIEARMGIEYLLFEELVISTGARLSREDYEQCLKNRNSFSKLIRQLSPDHLKAQEFTRAVTEIETAAPTLVYWDPRELEKAWGKLSKCLHWVGARTETTDDKDWLDRAGTSVRDVVVPIWDRISSGQSGLLHPSDMNPQVHQLWEDFRSGRIELNSVKIRLEILRPAHA